MKKEKVNMKREVKNKNVLIVIPAYNEEKSIDNVLKELKEFVNFADIIVINDCSYDNTKKVVLDNNIKCINNIFNMDSSFAILTGIKYAYENNYGYVIQMDADGQHLAYEVIKLYDSIKKYNVDVIIGSRYLEDLGYECSFFRRIGTLIFELLIKIFCKERITDPLSGFRCYNKKVINEFMKFDSYPEYLDANILIKLLNEGYIIKEVPVKMKQRENGKSKYSGIIQPIKYMVKMFYTIFWVLILTQKKKRG